MIPHARLAAVIGVWAAVTWGGRIGLLAGDETFVSKARIAVSLAVALLAVVAILTRATWVPYAVGLYSGTNLLVWSTSVVSVLGDPSSSVAFKLVHLVLAAVSIGIAATAWVLVISRSGPASERRSGARSRVDR